MRKLISICLLFLVLSCKDDGKENGEGNIPVNNVPAPATVSYNVVNIFPHDTGSFTQGLQWYGGYLYEGTGLEGHSHLMKVDLTNGNALQKVSLDNTMFGEGITILRDKIYQLTWENRKVFVYDVASFKKLKEFNWDHPGWGITNDSTNLIISTGSDKLYFVEPESFKLLKIVSVSNNNGAVGNINELEYVDGKIYANLWQSDHIVRIDPVSGFVEARIDLTGILEKSGKKAGEEDVLNGIAYDKDKNSFYVTGKKWPALFEIKLNQ